MTIHLKYYPSGSIGICLAVFIGGVGVEGVVGEGGVWIHLLLLLHIYTLPVTDKVIDFFQDHVHCVFLGVGVGGVVFGSISCSCSTFIHYQSLTRSLTSFKTIYIVYELASFKTIISTRGGWW